MADGLSSQQTRNGRGQCHMPDPLIKRAHKIGIRSEQIPRPLGMQLCPCLISKSYLSNSSLLGHGSEHLMPSPSLALAATRCYVAAVMGISALENTSSLLGHIALVHACGQQLQCGSQWLDGQVC